jgi:iron complex outermembrane receptor protein
MYQKLLFISLFVFSFFPGYSQDTTEVRNYKIDDLVITANRVAVNRNNVPMTISVISRQELEGSSESALLPGLSERIPGLFVTERGVTGFGVGAGGGGGITIRGVGGAPTSEVLMLIDGQPQYMGIMGHHLPDSYVTSDVERVEVIRGPASILYGSNAMGGVINIITRKQDREGWNANARLMYGSYNTQKYMGNAGIKYGKVDAFLSVNHDRTDGHRDKSNFHITNAYARTGYKLSERFKLWADFMIASNKSHDPGEVTQPITDHIADVVRGMASLTLENDHGMTAGALKLFYNFGDHEVNDGYYPGQTQPRDFRYRSTDHNFGVSLYQGLRLFEGNMVTVGVDFKDFGGHAWNKYVNGRPSSDIIDTSVYEVAGYVIMQQTLFNRLTLNAGVRLDHNKAFGNEWIPQAGFAYTPFDATVIKGSVSKGFRSPTIREMYMWGMANPDLRPERMVNYEIALEQRLFDDRLALELVGYIAEGADLIRRERVGGRYINTNSGDFLHKGIEFSAHWHVLKELDIHGNYSYLHMDAPLLYSPKHQAFLSANYRLKQWNFNVNYHYVADMYSVVESAPETETYGLLNVRVSYKPLSWLDIFVKGENLTAKKYEIMKDYTMPGFTIFGGVGLSFR